MKEFNDLIQAAVSKMDNDGKIEKIITECVEKTVKGSIEEALREYSDFGKAVKEKVKNVFKFDLNFLSLPGYNETIAQILKAKLSEAVNIRGAAQISEQIGNILNDVPTEIKLSELVEKFKEDCQDHSNHGDKITCEIQKISGSNDGVITLAPHRDQSYCRASISLQYDGDDGHVYSFRIGSEDYSKKIFANARYGFQKLLFGLYACRAKLVIDESEVDEYFHDDEDND
jgi:hypothetical protein